jgi:hypothetical protein
VNRGSPDFQQNAKKGTAIEKTDKFSWVNDNRDWTSPQNFWKLEHFFWSEGKILHPRFFPRLKKFIFLFLLLMRKIS